MKFTLLDKKLDGSKGSTFHFSKGMTEGIFVLATAAMMACGGTQRSAESISSQERAPQNPVSIRRESTIIVNESPTDQHVLRAAVLVYHPSAIRMAGEVPATRHDADREGQVNTCANQVCRQFYETRDIVAEAYNSTNQFIGTVYDTYEIARHSTSIPNAALRFYYSYEGVIRTDWAPVPGCQNATANVKEEITLASGSPSVPVYFAECDVSSVAQYGIPFSLRLSFEPSQDLNVAPSWALYNPNMHIVIAR